MTRILSDAGNVTVPAVIVIHCVPTGAMTVLNAATLVPALTESVCAAGSADPTTQVNDNEVGEGVSETVCPAAETAAASAIEKETKRSFTSILIDRHCVSCGNIPAQVLKVFPRCRRPLDGRYNQIADFSKMSDTEQLHALHTAVNSYLTTLLAIAECVGSACPEVGGPYRHRLSRLRGRLAFDATPEAMIESTEVVERELKDYSKKTAHYIGQHSVEIGRASCRERVLDHV